MEVLYSKVLSVSSSQKIKIIHSTVILFAYNNYFCVKLQLSYKI